MFIFTIKLLLSSISVYERKRYNINIFVKDFSLIFLIVLFIYKFTTRSPTINFRYNINFLYFAFANRKMLVHKYDQHKKNLSELRWEFLILLCNANPCVHRIKFRFNMHGILSEIWTKYIHAISFLELKNILINIQSYGIDRHIL